MLSSSIPAWIKNFKGGISDRFFVSKKGFGRGGGYIHANIWLLSSLSQNIHLKRIMEVFSGLPKTAFEMPGNASHVPFTPPSLSPVLMSARPRGFSL